MCANKFKNVFFLSLTLTICLALAAPADVRGAITGTVNVRIKDTKNDAEERMPAGTINDDSSDLELGYDGSTANLVGLRFPNIQVPRGATITRAYIQFYCDEVTTGPASFTIWGHDYLLSAEFDKDNNYDISSREKTSASVAWNNIPDWNKTHDAHQTPDITPIVQEIVDRVGAFGVLWNPGRTMTFFIAGTGKRTAESVDGTSSEAPLLHIEFTSDAAESRISDGDDDVEQDPDGDIRFSSSDLEMSHDGSDDQHVGLRFQNVKVPQGAVITNAYITFMADEKKYEETNLIIEAEASDNAPAFADINYNVSDRPRTGKSVTWANIPAWDTVGELHSTPDLKEIVQEIVGRSGWVDGYSMVFIITGLGVRTADSYNGNAAGAPLLHIEFSEGAGAPYINVDQTNLGSSCYEGENASSVDFTLTNSGSADLNYSISVDQTWVSLNSAGGSPLIPGGSADYAVNFSTSGLPAGTHEATITIDDASATNGPVEIQVSVTIFEVEVTPTCGNVPLYAENLVSPAVLILLDVSGSMKTKMDIDTNEKQQTPDLKNIIQEIINRSGWKSGQSMAFKVDFSKGDRKAKSYDGDSGSAPLLHVEYNDGVAHEINVRISAGSDDAEENKDGNMSLTANDLTLKIDNPVGLRFRNVTIPAGADVTRAYIEFTVDETDKNGAEAKIYGEAFDDPATYAVEKNNITGRYETSVTVDWKSIADWKGTTKEKRIDIGKSVISDLVKDRSISWGFGTWTTKKPYDDEPDYTLIHVGTKPHDEQHQQDLQDAIAPVKHKNSTPFAPSINAANNYFSGKKRDKNGAGDLYDEKACQPKFLIDVTDGRGNTGSSVALVKSATENLADSGVSPIGVGFGLKKKDAEQLYEMAKVANEKGNELEFDQIYGLHEEIAGVGQPYFAYNKQELIDKLKDITENIKGAIFHGSAPAPTTSADLGNTLVVAKFDASRWTGDVEALTRVDPKKGWTSDNINSEWAASSLMPTNPADRNVWTIDPVSPYNVVKYEDGTLAGDNWLCKPIGDIINSTPVVVGTPPFFYNFDHYSDFRYNIIGNDLRPPLIYVGSNDGALHAFSLNDYTPPSGPAVSAGQEVWAFVPKSLHDKLELAATDEKFDPCAAGFCHQYLLDGSPMVADIAHDFNGNKEISADEWRTILVAGLREGGQAYFALDVTSGQDFKISNPDPAKHLWEFTDFYDLGETWSEPSINRVSDDRITAVSSKTIWAAYFGSGYSPTSQSTKKAYLYGIEAYDASDLWSDGMSGTTNKIQMSKGGTAVLKYHHLDSSFETPDQVGATITGSTSGAKGTIVSVTVTSSDKGEIELENVTGTFIEHEPVISSGGGEADPEEIVVITPPGTMLNDALASPLVADIEGDAIAERIYVGNLYGNMYRVTDIGKDQEPSVSTLFTFDHTVSDINPIRAKADYAYAYEYDHIWLYFGTGRYEDQAHKNHSASQYFFGLRDWTKDAYNPVKPLPTYRLNDLANHKAEFVSTQIEIEGQMVDRTYRVISGTNPNRDPWAVELFAKQSDWGWSGPMPAGSERVLVKPLVLGGVVFFVTFIPDEDICAGNGESWLFAVDFETGLIPEFAVWDINGDGLYDEKDMIDTGETDAQGNPIKAPPNGIFMGRGQASHLVFHDGYLFYTTTGSGDDDDPDGGPGGTKPNLSDLKVRLRSWKQQ